MSLFDEFRPATKTPVFVLTGFLGSGKTTLLNRALRSPLLADTAVIVNELGDVALDHLLVERIDGEVALLPSGCVCCAVRSDFEQTLRDLLARRADGELAFGRIVVETTGLADPAPLVQAVDSHVLLSHALRLGAVVTTVDAVNAPHQLAHQWEARKQVALADTLIVTKRDLPEADDAPGLFEALDSLNPNARKLDAGVIDPVAELLRERDPMSLGQARREAAVGLLAGGHPIGPLHGDVQSIVLQAETPLDWMKLQSWLAHLRAEHGEKLLRVKGVVRVTEDDAPLLLHGVHHLFHQPLRAPQLAWEAGRSVLVMVVRGLDAKGLRTGFDACVA